MKRSTNLKLATLFFKYDKEQETECIGKELEEKSSLKTEENNELGDSYAPFNFSWFVEDKVAAMGWPQTVENLNYITEKGVSDLITLSPEKLPPILECKKKLKWSEIRVKEFGAPTLKQIIKFVEICERAELRGEVIGVHCRHGRGRTGTMLACYLVYFKDMAPERAVLTVRVQRPGSCETYEQEKAVCHYHDCVRGTISQIDYKMVDDKEYFDNNIREYDDYKPKGLLEEEEGEKEEQEKEEEKPKKSKAMVINHKIYF